MTESEPLAFTVDRSVWIAATPELVFRYFTDSERFAAWWGTGSSIEARPGGNVVIQYPGAVIARGAVISVAAPRKIVFTYGYDDPAKPILPGASLVTVTMEEERGGTRVRLRHEVATAEVKDSHAPGWRFQLSLFANIASREAHADVAAVADRWFAAWNEADGEVRRSQLESAVANDIVFHDGFACIECREDLLGHIEAARKFMPGMVITRNGEPVQCQGTALVDWIVRGPDGSEQGRGTNVVEFTGAGLIRRVQGFGARGAAR